MGTNYYLLSKDKKLMNDNFATVKEWGIIDEEYQLVEEPFLAYRIHLNKLSHGWRPLFQRHKAFRKFKDIEKFYKDNEESLEIYDEYGKKFSWEEYYSRVYAHSQRTPEPVKWVYEVEQEYWDDPDHPFDWTEGEFF